MSHRVGAIFGTPVVRNSVELTIRSDIGGCRHGKLPELPFRVADRGLWFELQFEGSSRLKVQRRAGLLSRVTPIHDGSVCVVRGSDAQVSVRAGMGEELLVSDSGGRVWRVSYEMEHERRPFFALSQLRSLLGPVLRASAGHALVALLALLAIHAAKHVPGLSELLARQDRGAVAWMGSQTTRAELPDPFSGMSIRAFERAAAEQFAVQDAALPDAASRTSQVIGGILGRFKLGALGEETSGETVRRKIETIGIVASVLAGQESKARAQAPLRVAARVHSESGVSSGASRQEILIRQALDDIKPRLSHAFDEALRIDPGISVTLAYEGVVDARGNVSDVKIQAKGRYSPAALASLEHGVKLALTEIRLGPEHSGTVLRGEQVFVR